MKKVLIVDWLDKYGGAERVIASFQKIFRFEKIYTLVNVMQKKDLDKIIQSSDVSIVDTILRYTNKKFRLFYPLFFFFINKIKVDKEAKIIISSSHSVAKGIRKTSQNQMHISYFQARNSNYIWDEVDLYFGKLKYLFYPLIYLLRKIDVVQAQKPDYIISNSVFVQQWVKKTYGRTSQVIYPPVELSSFALDTQKEDYYVMIGRLATIKRFDIAIKTFNKNKKKLIIIGDGEEREKLQKMVTSPNIVFTGFLESQEINQYLKKAKALIQIGIEGFGIASIEAQACGTPVIAYQAGGIMETVIHQKTGVLFKEQTPESLQQALNNFETISWDYPTINQNAMRFSAQRFEKEIKEYVAKCEKEYFLNILNIK